MTVSSPGTLSNADRYVAIDVETTGINPERDVIIEVGIVVFSRDRVIERYSQLVNPRRPVPRDIQALTGIDEADLATCPTIDTLILDIRRLIGTSPIVGHNVDFDVSMLRRAGIDVVNRQLDTYTLATLVLP
ncbi:MAG TPA: 3'-5' exonuclease, partial [Thermomicrobiales bacterium]|nr:3'-5' exonuclease [Thermomicrobiales bacterium]